MNHFDSYLFKVALCVSILILPCNLFGFQNEPESFRGVRWGTNINVLSDTEFNDHENETLSIYINTNDKMKIRDAEVKEIKYHFYKGRFFGVRISFIGITNFYLLKSTFFDLYGKPRITNQFIEEYYWFGTKVAIMFKYNDTNEKGEIFYSYKPIGEELLKNEKRSY